MSTPMLAAAIVLSAAITFGLRALPFLIFSGERKMPDWLQKLGEMLPSAIMAVLIIYCLKDVPVTLAESASGSCLRYWLLLSAIILNEVPF